ncbi:MAG: hypothetical protein ACK4H7_00980 [Acidilobaceae archaeon]
MTSESFEEREKSEEPGVELVERRGEEGEEIPPVEGEALEEEPALLYDVTKPEILEVMMNAVEILSDASEGIISIDDVKKLYRANVERKLRELIKAGTIIKKPKSKRARKEKKPEKAKKPKPKEEKPEKKPSKKKPKTRKTKKT